MTRLLVLLALVALVGCGSATAANTPVPTPAPSASDLLAAIEDSGLLMTRKASQNIHTCATQQGLLDYQEFVQREEAFYPRHAIASYATAQQAEAARNACAGRQASGSNAAFRRGTVVLIWALSSNVPADAYLPYFAVLQALR